jgi:hypothetical protein
MAATSNESLRISPPNEILLFCSTLTKVFSVMRRARSLMWIKHDA